MRFCGACSAALAPAVSRRRDGELRLLTIVFCDLVGSTERSTQLDPEDLRNLIRHYQQACHDAVERLGGRIVNFIGDGVLAAFGAPLAREDSTRRAVDAALDMVAATSQLTWPDGHSLAARAAVHTGSVVVSQMGSGVARVELDLTGEAANTAARLQGRAPPGGVLISAAAAQAVWGHFTLEPVGELDLKGLAEPLSAYEVRGHTGAVDRLSARVVTGLAPFVGRAHELEVVVERAVEADAGSPQTVVIVGEAGIGKSRLLREAQGRSPLAGARTIVLRGEQDRTSTPFGPFLSLLDQLADEPPAAIDAPVELVEVFEPNTGGETADQRRRRTIAILQDWICEQAHHQLVALVVEDLHWVDPSTLEVISALQEVTAEVRLAVLATARPTWVSTWPPSADVTIVTLDPLDQDAIGGLLASLGVQDLAPVRRLVDRAEGVPLYLEEIAGLAGRGEAVDPDQVPLTIAELLSARLEATGDSGLASDCSVLGTDIDSNVAATVLELDHDQLRARLDQLVAGGIMRHHEGRGYGFRHGLLRDAAYSMLLRSDRTRLHAAAAEALDQLDPDSRREEIARHWEGAGRSREATAAWQRAGELATDRSAFVEAGSYYEAARRTLLMLPDGPDRLSQELLLLLHATTISFRLSGGAAPETLALNAQLEQLSDQARSATDIAPGVRLMVISTMHLYYSAKPDYRRAAELNPDLEPFITRGGIAAALAVWMRGTTRVMMGDDARAEADLLYALEIYDPTRKQIGQPDLAVVSAALLAVLATGRGQSERADEWLRAAFDYLALHDDPFHRGWLTLTAAKVMARRGDRALALTFADEALEVALAHGFEQIEPQARGLQAWASSLQPNHDLFETLLTVLRDMATSGSRSDSSMQLLLLTQSLAAAGRRAEAEDAYASLLAFCEETSEWMYRREITALGEQLGAQGPAPDPAPPPDPTPTMQPS
jgi:class 3 adenylate cyclase/tetratricopeptide (TPR) repeat protein